MACATCNGVIDGNYFAISCGHRYHTDCFACAYGAFVNEQTLESQCAECHARCAPQNIVVGTSDAQFTLMRICDAYLSLIARCLLSPQVSRLFINYLIGIGSGLLPPTTVVMVVVRSRRHEREHEDEDEREYVAPQRRSIFGDEDDELNPLHREETAPRAKTQTEIEIEHAEKVISTLPQSAPTTSIQVRVAGRKPISVPIATSDYVLHLMRRIREVEGIAEKDQQLICAGHKLRADTRLAEYDLPPNSVIHVIAKTH